MVPKLEKSKIRRLAITQRENILRSHWSLGHVIEIYSGKDGIVQTVKVETSTN